MFMDVVNPCDSIADPFVSGFIGWPDLGDDGLDLCFSLLLACPFLSAAAKGEGSLWCAEEAYWQYDEEF